MANCDICNAALDVNEATAFSIEDLQEVISKGFGPPDRILQRAMAAGWTREQVIARWQQELDARPQPYWMLCPSCAARAAVYLPAAAVSAAAEAAAPAAVAEAVPEVAPEVAPAGAPAAAPAAEVGSEEAAAEAAAAPAPEEAAVALPEAAGPRPRTGRVFLVGLLLGLVGGTTLFLLVIDRYLHPAGRIGTVTVTTVVPNTAVPTGAFPTMKPATPRPTEALWPPTLVPMPDVSRAVLTLEDMPSGFRAMPEANMATLGFAQDALVGAFPGLEQGRLKKLMAFDQRRTSDFAVAFLVYPLTPEERVAFDRALSGPDAGQPALWSALAARGWSLPERVAVLDNVGEQAVWLTSRGSGDTAGLRTDIALARRGPVIEVVIVGYKDGDKPQVDLVMTVRTLDSRLAATVPLPAAPGVAVAPLPDLSAVVLQQADFPSGFVAMTEREMDEAGITAEKIAADPSIAGLNLAAARPANLSTFVDPTAQTPVFVVSYLLYPLTERETALIDRDISNPQLGVGLWSTSAGSEGLTLARVLDDLGGLGDASGGLTVLDTKATPPTRMEMAVVRRGRVAVVLMLGYEDKHTPRVKIGDLAAALDARLAAALGSPLSGPS